MLRIVYRAVDLKPGVISDWHEERGLFEVLIDRHTTPDAFVRSLNQTLHKGMSNASWYQLWDGEVVSVTSPDRPLRVTFELSRLFDAPPVEIRERRGHVTCHVAPTVTAEEFTRALNPAAEAMLSAGQWFQLWHGEIITVDSLRIMAA